MYPDGCTQSHVDDAINCTADCTCQTCARERAIAEHADACERAKNDPDGEWLYCAGALVRRGAWGMVAHNGVLIDWNPGPEEGHVF